MDDSKHFPSSHLSAILSLFLLLSLHSFLLSLELIYNFLIKAWSPVWYFCHTRLLTKIYEYLIHAFTPLVCFHHTFVEVYHHEKLEKYEYQEHLLFEILKFWFDPHCLTQIPKIKVHTRRDKFALSSGCQQMLTFFSGKNLDNISHVVFLLIFIFSPVLSN